MTSQQQLAAVIAEGIASGLWRGGDPLPAVRELASRYNASNSTVNAALQTLERRGLVHRPRYRRATVVDRNHPKGQRQIAILLRHEAMAAPASSPWTHNILATAEASLFDEGMTPIRLPVGDEPEDWDAMLDRLPGRSVAGVVFRTGVPRLEQLIERMNRDRIPWVLAKSGPSHIHHNFVDVDLFHGGVALGTLAQRAGINSVVFLGPDRNMLGSAHRFGDGIRSGYCVAGGDPNRVATVLSASGYERQGYEAVSGWLAEGHRPGLIAASGHLLAMGAARACREYGMRVPEDVALVGRAGFDVFMDPPLTTVHEPLEEVGREAARRLLAAIREDLHSWPGVSLPTRLILRQSFDVPDALLADLPDFHGTTIERAADDAKPSSSPEAEPSRADE